MDDSGRTISSSPSAPPNSVFHALVEAPGRRGVRILGLTREQIIMVSISTVLFIIPTLVFVSLLPFWDRIGEFAFLQRLNSFVAPSLETAYELKDEPRLAKRILISSLTLVQLLLLSKFIALCVRSVRRHALHVWICYDRTKLLRYFAISAVVFLGLWYVLFFDWTVMAFLQDRGPAGSRVMFYSAMALPFATFIFGHLAAIVALGAWRTISQKTRRSRLTTNSTT